MSLINDALKKAQRQQTGGAPASTPAETSAGGATPRIERREKPADFRSQVLILGGVSLGLLLALMVGGFFWWRGSHSTEPAPVQPVAQVTPPAKTETKPEVPAPTKSEIAPEPTKTEATPTTATTTAATPQFTLPLAPATSVQPASTATNPAATVQLPVATPSADVAKAPPAERPKAPPQMVKLIESFRITGIRSSGGDSKVLMNDRVYRIGDTVDIDLGLKLTGVAQGALTFENAHGAVYTRNF